MVIFFLLVIIARCIYFYYEIDVKYDNRVISCDINDNELNLSIKGQSVWNTHYTVREIDNEKTYFFHSTVSIYNKRRSNWEYSHSMARLLESKDVIFGAFHNLELDNKKTKVYYTDNSIKSIEKATEQELKNIIKTSYLMCESND